MRPIHWLLLAITLLFLGVFPSAAVFLADLLGVAGGVAFHGAAVVLEQPPMQVALALGIVVRHFVRRRAA